jgi:thiamine-phosphate pyrophosphorylase
VRFVLTKLYPITDVSISGLTHLEQAERFAAGGARIVQLREKKASPREWYDDAAACARFCGPRGIKLIVNDRVDIAAAIKADGVHLGQDDMPVSAARELLGPAAIIGLSTHSIEQVREAITLPVNYIGFGPIFDTTTKENPDAVVGLEMLREASSIAGDIPIVAIGGIRLANVAAVLDAGAASVAIIKDLLANPAEIESKTRCLVGL